MEQADFMSNKAVDEMSKAETFRGYPPAFGCDFLLDAINENDYKAHGVELDNSEIFVSDGAKSDTGNIGDIFSLDNKVAICDPVYPVYVDTNVMAGRSGDKDENGIWSNIIYMPCIIYIISGMRFDKDCFFSIFFYHIFI